MKVNYTYKKESDIDSFKATGSVIELKEYMNDLVLYSPLNDYFRAEFALYNKAAKYTDKPTIFTGGPFGSYLKIKSPYSFDLNNFDTLDTTGRISFYLCNNKLVNSSVIGLRAKKTFPKNGLPAGTYTLTVTVQGYPTATLNLNLFAGSTAKTIKNKLLFELDPSVYPFEINSANSENNVIALQSLYEGKPITISDGLDGNNLLDYFDVETIDYGSAPKFENTIFKLFNLEIKHISNNVNGLAKSFLKFIFGEDEFYLVEWNTDSVKFDNIEIDFDENLTYIFLNGELKVVQIVKNKFKNNGQELVLCPNSKLEYSFDELIINKKCIHTKSFKLPERQLTKYNTQRPFIDFYFPENELKDGMELTTNTQLGINCCICDNGIFYYYNAGSWRRASGSYMDTNDFATTAEKLKEYPHSGQVFFVRCFFVSDGSTPSYIDTPYFYLEDTSYEDKNGNTSAILIGDKEWSKDGKPITEYLTGKKLIIKTQDGESVIEFTYPNSSLDSSSDSSDDSSEDNDKISYEWTIQDVLDAINSYYPEGIAKCSKDSKDRVILISEDKGKDAFISVSGDVAPLIFGYTMYASGTNANAGTIDYTDFYNAVRTYTSKILLSEDEIPDSQMKLFLKEALGYYKKYRATETNQYTCQLKGNWQEGYEIPSVIESQKDIIDIIFKPIFPILFYGSDFISNGSENIFTLTLAQSLFGGRGGMKNSQGITQDYYISLMGMQDFRQTLGLNPSWEIMNNRIYIFPSQVTRFTNVAIKYKAPLSEEECLNDPDIIKYVHGKCLMALGNIRGQYGAQFAFGENQLTFNADQLYERGKTLVDEVMETWKKQQPALGFFLG